MCSRLDWVESEEKRLRIRERSGRMESVSFQVVGVIHSTNITEHLATHSDMIAQWSGTQPLECSCLDSASD